MRGEGTSVSQPKPRMCSGRKTLRRCKNKEEPDNVVVIDVDSDNFGNVIFIDVAESLPKRARGPSYSAPRKNKKYPLRTVICIDDDENPEDEHTGIGVEGNVNLHGEGSSSGTSSPSPNYTHNPVDIIGDECQFVQENKAPLKLSKCKRTYSGKAFTSNRFGLNTDSESVSSDDDDGPDFELEGSSGKLREQWEKAFWKRKNVVHSRGDRAGTHTYQDVGAENKTERCTGDSDAPNSSRATDENVDGSPAVATEKGNFRNTFCGKRQPPDDNGPNGKLRDQWEKAPFERKNDVHNGQSSMRDQASSSCFCTDNAECQTHKRFECREYNPQGSKIGGGSKDKTYVNSSVAPSEEKNGGFPQDTSCGSPSFGKSEVGVENGSSEGVEEPAPEEPSVCKYRLDEQQLVHRKAGLKEKSEVSLETMSNGRQEVEKEDARNILLHGQSDGAMSAAQSSLINDREMIKETDEYKRAIEEEWACRQRALKIQAEEAQHLKRLLKRKKSESMRLLDMERRQKQRVDEMRETQKKDEENMNLKEQLRAEARKELNKLETTCGDMASVLRGLGIPVNGGLHPLSNEVHAAYKRALLCFHPDRASRSDVRQQVEAEEKFKLISRMKDKFL